MTTDRNGAEDPSPPLRVVQLMRRTFPGHFSIERVFDQIRPELGRLGCDVERVVAADYSLGVWPRVRTTVAAARLRAPVVHVTGDITFAGLLRHRRGTVITVHDTEFLERASRAKRLVYTWLWLRLPAWRAEVLTVPSEATRHDVLAVLRSGRGKVRVVPNPVSASLHPIPAEDGRPLPETPVILLVGTRPNKNLLRSLAALTGLRCRLLIVGAPTPEQAVAIERSDLDVEIRVDLDEDGLRACYEECDLVLFPSTKEGFGIPVLEGQAMCRPVVTSNRPPMADVAGVGGAELVDPEDPDSMRAGVERVLGDAGHRAALVAAGRDNVAGYTPEAVAARYAAIYDEVARRR